ncbi:hypothetical protein KM043_007060 [Ampulex compressa]|nr:hypothetical protein KM043_007060 [Ampulex compressa]
MHGVPRPSLPRKLTRLLPRPAPCPPPSPNYPIETFGLVATPLSAAGPVVTSQKAAMKRLTKLLHAGCHSQTSSAHPPSPSRGYSSDIPRCDYVATSRQKKKKRSAAITNTLG